MPLPVAIIKIDPEKRKIVRMAIIPSVKGVRSIIGCSKIGHRVILDSIPGLTKERLLVAARIDQPRDKPHAEWRLRGTENTVGVGFLFGTRERKMDGMWHCPVDVAWVEREIVWCAPGETAPAAEVAERMGIPVMNEGAAGGEEAQGALLEEKEAGAGDARRAPDGGREAPRVANDVEVEKGPGS